MADSSHTLYEANRDRARSAIARQQRAAENEKRARDDRDAAVLAMLAVAGATLGKVAADVGLSKSMVAYIQKTQQQTITTAEQARAFLAQHPDA